MNILTEEKNRATRIPPRRQGLLCASSRAQRKSPRARWYLLRVAEGSEQALCDKLGKLVSSDLLEDIFVMRKERWRKSAGVWGTYLVPVHPGYAFIVTKDARALEEALSRLSSLRLMKASNGRYLSPSPRSAQRWYEGMLDEDHVIRTSTAVIEEGILRVQSGPLMGQEERVVKIDRHKRTCLVNLEGAHLSECLSMHVPVKD